MKACFQIAECSFSCAKISIFIITTNIKKRLKRILPWPIDEDVVFLFTFVSRYIIKNNKKDK